MQRWIFIFTCIAIVYYAYYCGYESSKKLHSFFVVGILSARENFELRKAARSTWLKDYLPHKDNDTKAWFVIGKDDCKIPPKYRLNEYGCTKWNISESVGLKDHFSTSSELYVENCHLNSKNNFKQGFSFKVNHPVVVKKLGILYHLLVPNTEVKVAILDVQSQEVVVQTIIKKTLHTVSGYLYEDVEPIKLPKHYEGLVLVEGYLQTEACSHISWNDGGGVITFNQIYSSPSHLESVKFTNALYSAASIYFFVDDIMGLKEIKLQEDVVTRKWLQNLESLNKRLLKESEEKKDILFVNVTDTYRNLPIKLLHFYQWLSNYEFSYAIKCDDDSVIDLPHLISKIQRDPQFKSNERWIWSRFRRDWPVNYIGKWADYDFKSSLYPAFPCGATYVLSWQTVKWLTSNSNDLFSYQGEDVSMGIWLSAIKPNLIDDPNFACDSICDENNYNRAQLTPDQIYKVWSLYEKCGNLCSCQ